MNVVESRNVREILLFRIKSLNACGMPEIAAIIEADLAEIMRDETSIHVMNPREIQTERLWRIRNASH